MDCGGKRQRDAAFHPCALARPKAPSPLRFAGALQRI
jgi:hypothetical protein